MKSLESVDSNLLAAFADIKTEASAFALQREDYLRLEIIGLEASRDLTATANREAALKEIKGKLQEYYSLKNQSKTDQDKITILEGVKNNLADPQAPRTAVFELRQAADYSTDKQQIYIDYSL